MVLPSLASARLTGIPNTPKLTEVVGNSPIPAQCGSVCMVRSIVAWLLIIVGLIGLIGGVGMAYVSSVALGTAADNAQQANRMDPFAVVPARGPGRSEKASLYGMAALYVVVGGVMTYAGVRLRTPTAEKKGQ